MLNKVNDPSFATVAGLILWAEQQGTVMSNSDGFLKSKAADMIKRGTGDTARKAGEWFKKFLP
jgi:NaMN:DMB phosphoribosyltransferase